ncbi:hypothetical protein P154DRAFT_521122 [Amniculicola lignicola CBS 123094]|uniref:STEEP1 domain-containing protein n=1 Tax=Amniculicola lignicola CBS 123094 TaxID=1392246 RepID=A0A6A5WLD0_9PLEO|nr:hypothetical protein P154DRAFT_521122 [Amniculicola lignicola CBS 123094]
MSTPPVSLAASNTVYTYHCLCSHLLVATTTPLPSLPVRQATSTHEQTHIMPLPPPPAPLLPKKRSIQAPMDHYGLLLSTTPSPAPEIHRSDDGFEKRYLQRCNRCSLVVGYQLDWEGFEGAGRSGRREDVVFLLRDGFMSTSEMIMAKRRKDAGGAMDEGVGVGGMAGQQVGVPS